MNFLVTKIKSFLLYTFKSFFLYLHFANKCQNFQFFVYIGIINTCMHCGNAFVCLYNKFTIYSVI